MIRGTASLAFGLLALHASARAQTGPELQSALRVEPSADGCVSEATLTPRVRRWLAAGPQRSEVEVAVRADTEPVSFSVLRQGVAIAERRFDVLPAACSDRLDAIAVAIAVALEHARSQDRAGAAADGAETGTQARDTEQQPADVAAPAEDAAPEPRAPEEGDDVAARDDAASAAQDAAGVELRAFASATLLFEVLPETAFALGAGAELQPSPLRLAAGLLVSLPSESELAGGSARSQLLAARAHACLGTQVGDTDLDVEGCAGAAAGVVLASGDGFDQDDDTTMAWAAGSLRAAARYPADGPISLRLALDGLLHAVRPELEVTRGLERLTDAPGPVGAAGSLELVIRLR